MFEAPPLGPQTDELVTELSRSLKHCNTFERRWWLVDVGVRSLVRDTSVTAVTRPAAAELGRPQFSTRAPLDLHLIVGLLDDSSGSEHDWLLDLVSTCAYIFTSSITARSLIRKSGTKSTERPGAPHAGRAPRCAYTHSRTTSKSRVTHASKVVHERGGRGQRTEADALLVQLGTNRAWLQTPENMLFVLPFAIAVASIAVAPLRGMALIEVLLIAGLTGLTGALVAAFLLRAGRCRPTLFALRSVRRAAEDRLASDGNPNTDRELITRSLVVLGVADRGDHIELPPDALEALYAGLCRYTGQDPPFGSAALEAALINERKPTSQTGWLRVGESALENERTSKLLQFGIELSRHQVGAPTTSERPPEQYTLASAGLKGLLVASRKTLAWTLALTFMILAATTLWAVAPWERETLPLVDANLPSTTQPRMVESSTTNTQPPITVTSEGESASGNNYIAHDRVLAASLSGTVEIAPSGTVGVDSFAPLGRHADALVATGYRFCVRYVPLHASDERRVFLTRAEAQKILSSGLALMLVQEGAEWRNRKPTAKLGDAHGRAAVEAAEALGYAQNAVIFVDIESVYLGSSEDIIAYVEAWYRAVAPSYAPGMYVGPNPKLDATQLGMLPFEHFWKSGAHVPTPRTRGFQVIQYHQVWIAGQKFDHDMTQTDAAGGGVPWLQPHGWVPAD